ncbi:NACHT domain-containing protein [Streptomyces nodosus]
MAAILYILVAGTVFTVLGKVYRDLQGQLSKAVAKWVWLTLLARLSRFETRYRSYLRHRHSVSNLKGLEIQGVHNPRLEDVFVDVSLQARPWHELQGQSLAGQEPAYPARPTPERTSLGRLLETSQPAVLTVLGSPGSGKTTLLEHTTLTLASGKRRWVRARNASLPILLALREHVRDFAPTTAGSPASPGPGPLANLVRRSLTGVSLGPEPTGWFEDQLDKGRCVIMLDGLDEVSNADDRRRTIEWVERQIARYPKNRWVLTSRPHGYGPLRLSRAQVLEVRRFTPEQITNFVMGWYRAIEQLDNRGGRENDANAKATDLLRRMREEPMLYDLGSNPLLLTMIANVHRYRGALPGTRSELYAEICQVLLWKRKEAEGLPIAAGEPSGADKEEALQELAYVMMSERVSNISSDEAMQWVRPSLSAAGFTVSANQFLAEISKCGLLVEREPGVYSFAHQTFQEYLAAAYIAKRGTVDVLIQGIEDAWWRETILLWAVRSVDPSAVINACLERDTATTLALAFDCMQDIEDGGNLNVSSRRWFHELRTRVLNSQQDLRLRGLMTAVEVERRLRRVVWISAETLVCASPITGSLYALSQTGNRDGADGTEETVVLGISQQDAVRFVEWVNNTVGDGSRYRLPYTTEAADPAMLPVIGAGRAIWTLPDPGTATVAQQSAPQLWVPTGIPHPWSTSETRVQERLTQDEAPVRQRGRDEGATATDTFGSGQRLVETLHTGLIRELEQWHEELSGGDLFDSPHAHRDARAALEEELNRNGARRIAMERCGPALGLGRRLAHIVDLAVARADCRRMAALLATDTSDLRRALGYSQQASLLARSVAPVRVTALTVLESLGGLLHSNCGSDLGLAAAMVAARAQVLSDRVQQATTRARPPRGTSVVYMTSLRSSLDALAAVAPTGNPRDQEDSADNHVSFLAAEVSRLTATLCERELIASQPEICGIIRIAAMTLAAASELHRGSLAEHSRTIAAAITILQDRSEGALPACEALLLVRQ